MNVIENKLNTVRGFLMSIYRNSKEGWYEIEVGMPINWVIKETKDINCEVAQTTEKGKVIIISPKPDVNNVSIDDLIEFLNHVIETNKRVEEKEKQLKLILESEKLALEEKVKKYFDELETIKQSSFDEYEKDSTNDEPETKTTRKYIKKKTSEELTESKVDTNEEEHK